MKRSIFKQAILAVALGALVSGSTWATVTGKVGHAMTDSHPQAIAMNKFVELVGKYTNNNVQLKAFHSSVLGSDEKMLQGVQSGTQEFYIGTLAPFGMRVKEVALWDLPFMFASSKEVYAVLDGASVKTIFEKLEPLGVHGLSWGPLGFRNLSNSKHPVTKLEDISGLKLRVMPNPVALDAWKTLGANAVPMAFSEVFTALEMKAIDGQENPLVHMYTNKMQEVQKFISMTNHVYTAVALIVSKKFWDGLSEADKQSIQKAADEVKVLHRQLTEAAEKDVLGKFEAAGVKVNSIAPAELARIQEKVKPVVAKFAPQIGEDFIKGIYAEIDKARATK